MALGFAAALFQHFADGFLLGHFAGRAKTGANSLAPAHLHADVFLEMLGGDAGLVENFFQLRSLQFVLLAKLANASSTALSGI